MDYSEYDEEKEFLKNERNRLMTIVSDLGSRLETALYEIEKLKASPSERGAQIYREWLEHDGIKHKIQESQTEAARERNRADRAERELDELRKRHRRATINSNSVYTGDDLANAFKVIRLKSELSQVYNDAEQRRKSIEVRRSRERDLSKQLQQESKRADDAERELAKIKSSASPGIGDDYSQHQEGPNECLPWGRAELRDGRPAIEVTRRQLAIFPTKESRDLAMQAPKLRAQVEQIRSEEREACASLLRSRAILFREDSIKRSFEGAHVEAKSLECMNKMMLSAARDITYRDK